MTREPITPPEEILSKRLARNDKIIAFNLIVMNVAILALFVFSIFQNQAYLEQSRINGNKNHELTREYIKCIATILTKPLSQRTQEAFDACGIGGIPVKSADAQAKSPAEEDNNTIMFFTPADPASMITTTEQPTIPYMKTATRSAPAVQTPPSESPTPATNNTTSVQGGVSVNATGVGVSTSYQCSGDVGSVLGVVCL